jgi:hypothetical protein
MYNLHLLKSYTNIKDSTWREKKSKNTRGTIITYNVSMNYKYKRIFS